MTCAILDGDRASLGLEGQRKAGKVSPGCLGTPLAQDGSQPHQAPLNWGNGFLGKQARAQSLWGQKPSDPSPLVHSVFVVFPGEATVGQGTTGTEFLPSPHAAASG